MKVFGNYDLEYELKRLMWKLYSYIIWHLPRKFIYWCSIRLMSEATCTTYSSRHPDNISITEALASWEKK